VQKALADDELYDDLIGLGSDSYLFEMETARNIVSSLNVKIFY
jgi:hypothetical protein